MIKITEEDGYHYVYSEMFDYMAYGRTKEEALKHFEEGLYRTLRKRIERQEELYGELTTRIL